MPQGWERLSGGEKAYCAGGGGPHRMEENWGVLFLPSSPRFPSSATMPF